MDKSNYDENKIAEAREKLACHIMPPGSHGSANSSGSDAEASADKGGSQTDFIDENGKVLLTQMTTAGG